MYKWFAVVMVSCMYVLAACAAEAAGGTGIEYGLWEMESRIEMPGMPMAIPPTVSQVCITEKNAAPAAPAAKEKDDKCVMKDYRIDGRTVSWSVECKDQGTTTSGKGSVTYKSQSMSGTITMVSEEKSGRKTTMTQTLSGKRLGDCGK